jgi:ATP-binding cassette subfamily C protein CydD
VLLLTPEFYRPLRGLGAAWHAGMAGREAAAQLVPVLGGAPPRSVPRPIVRRDAPALAFEDVYAGWTEGAPLALEGVSFAVSAGASVGLVGPSGAGKSTVAALLLRFLEPRRGRVLADGRDIASLDRDEWCSAIAWLPQRPTVFHGSLLDNLRLGRPDVTDGEARAALEQAQLGELLAALPAGLETRVGERGFGLSAGEARRLALARAFLRDPALLVLDEPTAELDAASELAVATALERLRRGRTTLVISHRPAGLRGVDAVVHLRAGRVAPPEQRA